METSLKIKAFQSVFIFLEHKYINLYLVTPFGTTHPLPHLLKTPLAHPLSHLLPHTLPHQRRVPGRTNLKTSRSMDRTTCISMTIDTFTPVLNTFNQLRWQNSHHSKRAKMQFQDLRVYLSTGTTLIHGRVVIHGPPQRFSTHLLQANLRSTMLRIFGPTGNRHRAAPLHQSLQRMSWQNRLATRSGHRRTRLSTLLRYR